MLYLICLTKFIWIVLKSRNAGVNSYESQVQQDVSFSLTDSTKLEQQRNERSQTDEHKALHTSNTATTNPTPICTHSNVNNIPCLADIGKSIINTYLCFIKNEMQLMFLK